MDVAHTARWSLFRERFDHGSVVARVIPLAEGRAQIEVYDEAVALDSLDDPDGIDAAEARVKNTYGTGKMLRFIRAVKAACPNVVEWVYERVSGSAAFHGEKVRR